MGTLIDILIPAATVVACFAAMEFVAWFAHRYVMHGWLWFLHQDHHVREDDGFLERNDWFFVVFATPSIVAIYVGFTYPSLSLLMWAGVGIALYGAAYLFVHDIFVHQRIRLLTRTNSRYFRAMRRAHKVHHTTLVKDGAECFGFLIPPLRFFRDKARPRDPEPDEGQPV